jgi:hypothetical protein
MSALCFADIDAICGALRDAGHASAVTWGTAHHCKTGHFSEIDGTGRMIAPVELNGGCAMSTGNQNELREITENDLAAVTGGGYIHLHPTGFGARTDFMIAQKQLMESNYRGAIEAPTIRL